MESKSIESSFGEEFEFTLWLQATQGKNLALTHVEWEVWQDNVDLSDTLFRRGPWQLNPYGSLRLRFTWVVYCPPAIVCPDTGNRTEWEMTFFGKDANDQPVQFPMKLILPWVPPRQTSRRLKTSGLPYRKRLVNAHHPSSKLAFPTQD